MFEQSFSRKRVISTLLAVCLILSASITYAVLNPPSTNPKPANHVFIFHETMQGVEMIPTHNIRTNIAENYARDLFGFDNVTAHNATKWISLSNDASPLVTWTVLPNEVNANGFSRKLATVTAWMNGTDYAYNLTATWSATATQQLQCAGTQFSGQALSDNNLYAVASFTQTTFNYYDSANFDNLTIVWVYTYDFN